MTSTPETLDSARNLILEVLDGGGDEIERPELTDDDLLLFAVRRLSTADPEWLRERLLDSDYELERRLLVFAETTGPLREACDPPLRSECPEQMIWTVSDGTATAQSHGSAGDLAAPLGRLSMSGPRERELAAEELRDIVTQSSISTTGYRTVVTRLLEATLTESDEDVLEAILNAIAEAANVPNQAKVQSVDWTPLVTLLERSEEVRELEYVIEALGSTLDPTFRCAVARFSSHDSATVREAVRHALANLTGKTQ